MSKINWKAKKGIVLGSAIGLVVILVALALYFTGVYQTIIIKLGILDEKEVTPQVSFFEYVPKGKADMLMAGENILIGDESGVSCFNQDGDWLWSKELPLVSPAFVNAGEKVLVADIGGNGVHCFDKDGFLWTYITEDTILGISDNCVKNRFLVIHKAKSYLSAATVLDVSQEGKALASRKFGETYAVSGTFSPDGSQLVISGVSQSSGDISTVLTYMRMEGYEVFSTETMEGEFLPVVSFVKGTGLFASGGDSLRRLNKGIASSSSEDTNDLLWSRDGGAEKLVAVGNLPQKYYVTVSTATGAEENMEASCEITLYGSDGKKETSFLTEGGIQGVKMKGKTLALYTENQLYVYNIAGQRIGKVDSVSQITDVEFMSERVLVICGAAKMAKADFEV